MKTLKDNLGYITNQIEDLEVRLAGLQIEVDNLAEENGHFANFLERMNYTPCEIDNISNGWFTDRITDEGSQALTESEQSIEWFKTNGVHSWEDDGSVYIEVDNDNFEVFNVKIGTSEISYRADCYRNENQEELA